MGPEFLGSGSQDMSPGPRNLKSWSPNLGSKGPSPGVLGPESEVLGTGILDPRVLSPGYWSPYSQVLDLRFLIPGVLSCGSWVPGLRCSLMTIPRYLDTLISTNFLLACSFDQQNFKFMYSHGQYFVLTEVYLLTRMLN